MNMSSAKQAGRVSPREKNLLKRILALPGTWSPHFLRKQILLPPNQKKSSDLSRKRETFFLYREFSLFLSKIYCGAAPEVTFILDPLPPPALMQGRTVVCSTSPGVPGTWRG